MAKTTLKFTGKMIVNYDCEACDHKSSYEELIKIEGESAFAIEELFTRILKNKLKAKDFGSKSCPQCGYVQSWMIKSAKSRLGRLFGWAGFILIGISLLVLHGQTISLLLGKLFGRSGGEAVFELVLLTTGLIGMSGLAFTVIYRLVFDLHNPNEGRKIAPRRNKPQVMFLPHPEDMPFFDPQRDLNFERPISRRLTAKRTIAIFVLVMCFVAFFIVQGQVLVSQLGIRNSVLTYLVALLIGGVVATIVDMIGFGSRFLSWAATIVAALFGVGIIAFAGKINEALLNRTSHHLTLVSVVSQECQRAVSELNVVNSTGALGKLFVFVDRFGPVEGKLAAGLERPFVASLEAIDTLLCIEVEEVVLHTCSYEGDKSFSYIRSKWQIHVVDHDAGHLRATRTFFGGRPAIAPCPEAIRDRDRRSVYGSDPSIEEIKTWLATVESGAA